MRTLKLLLLGLIVVALVVLSLANRGVVTLHLLPEGMARVMPLSVQLPMFAVILLAILVGLFIGYLLEWLREHKHRSLASRKAREAEKLNRDMERLRRETGKSDDDVLTLLGSR
jgi:putative membrane protein